MLKSIAAALALSLMGGLSQASTLFLEAGNWAAVYKGNTCHVYTLSSARDTSGYLEFTFENNGLNATFDYIYTPYGPDEVEAPWDEAADSVTLYLGDEPVWFGDEMLFYTAPGFTYGASLTPGFISELIGAMLATKGAQLEELLAKEALGEHKVGRGAQRRAEGGDDGPLQHSTE